MRLIIESGVDHCHENLLTSNEVITLILDEYMDTSRHDLVLIVHEVGYECLQIYTVNVIYVVYMLLHYVLLFLYSDLGWHYSLWLQDCHGTC
jgi:hypothetical protein